ncbi:hypothetical protein [Herbaspirillum rubrisubalbicans]|uniref:hypothetical protein n=1 Tax=Herbaspirillum rubrisubalbicans TaxID=80842 RepID=UPI0011BF5644|nr:hypothetical protein [Herbaspirillum rubrisubalbicans]
MKALSERHHAGCDGKRRPEICRHGAGAVQVRTVIAPVAATRHGAGISQIEIASSQVEESDKQNAAQVKELTSAAQSMGQQSPPSAGSRVGVARRAAADRGNLNMGKSEPPCLELLSAT